MFVYKNILNIIGTFICALIVIFFATFFPYVIITSANHTVITQIDKIRFIGPLLILIGIIGYLLCFLKFILEAKGTPLPGGNQEHLIITGLYRYVRNPIYISWYFIILGEVLFFQSLDLLFYLFTWIIFFHLKVILFEEPSLRDTFGESYEQYCRSVRRWIPRLKIAHKKSE